MRKPKINRIKKIKWNTIKKVKNKSVEKLKEKLLFVKRIKQNIIKHKKSAKKRNKSLLIKSKRSKKAEKPIQKSFQENLKKKFLFKALLFKLKFQKFTKKNLIKTSTKYAVFKTKRFRQVFRRRKMLQKTRFRYRNVKKHKISTRINSFINFDKYEIMKITFFYGVQVKKNANRNIEVFLWSFSIVLQNIAFININLLNNESQIWV